MLQKVRYVLRKKLSEKLAVCCRLHRKRKKLRNKDMTIFSQNCVGGVMYHDLGLQFRSPTINLFMSTPDFVSFLENPKSYLQLPLDFIDSNCPYPVAKLGDLTIYFVHYMTPEEASEKWEARKKRINWDNVFVVMTDRDGCDIETVRRFEALPYQNRVLFSSKVFEDAPHCIALKRYEKQKMVGNLNEYISIFGKRVYEEGLDEVAWFNQELSIK